MRQGGRYIAVVASDGTGLVEAGAQPLRYLLAAQSCQPAEIVVHLDPLQCFARLPVGLRNDHHPIVQRHGGAVCGHASARPVVEGFELAAECRTGLDRRVQHVGKRHIDTESRAAVQLLGNIDSRPGGTDHAVLGDRLERRVLRDRQGGRQTRHTAE